MFHRASFCVEFWWAPSHADVEGKERPDAVAKETKTVHMIGADVFLVSPSMWESLIRLWHKLQSQEQTQIPSGKVLDLTKDSIIPANLRRTQIIPFGFFAVGVEQFLTRHFSMKGNRAYLHLCYLSPSSLCESVQVANTRGHLLLVCPNCHSQASISHSGWQRKAGGMGNSQPLQPGHRSFL